MPGAVSVAGTLCFSCRVDGRRARRSGGAGLFFSPCSSHRGFVMKKLMMSLMVLSILALCLGASEAARPPDVKQVSKNCKWGCVHVWHVDINDESAHTRLPWVRFRGEDGRFHRAHRFYLKTRDVSLRVMAVSPSSYLGWGCGRAILGKTCSRIRGLPDHRKIFVQMLYGDKPYAARYDFRFVDVRGRAKKFKDVDMGSWGTRNRRPPTLQYHGSGKYSTLKAVKAVRAEKVDDCGSDRCFLWRSVNEDRFKKDWDALDALFEKYPVRRIGRYPYHRLLIENQGRLRLNVMQVSPSSYAGRGDAHRIRLAKNKMIFMEMIHKAYARKAYEKKTMVYDFRFVEKGGRKNTFREVVLDPDSKFQRIVYRGGRKPRLKVIQIYITRVWMSKAETTYTAR